MELKNAICTGCGGKLQLNPALTKGICIYCGSEIMVAEAIAKAQQVEGIQTEDAARERAFQKLEDGNFDGADKDFLHIIDLNPTDCEAHYGRFKVALFVAEYYRRLNAGMARNMSDYANALTCAVESHGNRALKYAYSEDQKHRYQRQIDIVLEQIETAKDIIRYNNMSWFQKRGTTAPVLSKMEYVD